mgnify:CR=1 FL=1
MKICVFRSHWSRLGKRHSNCLSPFSMHLSNVTLNEIQEFVIMSQVVRKVCLLSSEIL